MESSVEFSQSFNPLLERAISGYQGMARSTAINDTYRKTINRFVSRAMMDDEHQNLPSAMRSAIRELTEQGIKTIDYTSGHASRMDSAVRNAMTTEFTQIVQEVQRKVGEEIGTDGVEISAHEHCAEDHEPLQGHMFTNEEYEKLQNGDAAEDIEGEVFQIDRPIGMWNCRHIAFPVIIGVSEPSFSPEELEEIKERNEEGVEYDGKHYTLYEAEQEQRRIETQIRHEKERLELLKELKDTDPLIQAEYNRTKRRLAELRGEYKELGAVLEPMAIRMKADRASVPHIAAGISPKKPVAFIEMREGWSPEFWEKLEKVKDYNSVREISIDDNKRTFINNGYNDIDDFAEQVKKYVSENPIMQRFDLTDTLENWSENPLVLNQFEIGKSRGTLDENKRNEWESHIAGMPIDRITMLNRERPVYGLIGNLDNYNEIPSRWYGESFLVYKDDVRNRVTYTIDNSSVKLGAFTNDPRALFNVDRKFSEIPYANYLNVTHFETIKKGITYMEVQIWGGSDLRKDVEKIVLCARDIEEITYKPGTWEKFKKMMDDAGVTIEDYNGNKL